MRLRRLRERKLTIDGDVELASLDPAENVTGPLEKLVTVEHVVSEGGAGDEQRSAAAESCKLERCDRSARLSAPVLPMDSAQR